MPRENKKKVSLRALKEKFANVFDTSKEIILDTMKITLIGNKEATIENYKAIIECTQTLMKVYSNSEKIKITGENLEMKTVTQDLLYIVGDIKNINFLR